MRNYSIVSLGKKRCFQRYLRINMIASEDAKIGKGVSIEVMIISLEDVSTYLNTFIES